VVAGNVGARQAVPNEITVRMSLRG